jgi:hypothetical protein
MGLLDSTVSTADALKWTSLLVGRGRLVAAGPSLPPATSLGYYVYRDGTAVPLSPDGRTAYIGTSPVCPVALPT